MAKQHYDIAAKSICTATMTAVILFIQLPYRTCSKIINTCWQRILWSFGPWFHFRDGLAVECLLVSRVGNHDTILQDSRSNGGKIKKKKIGVFTRWASRGLWDWPSNFQLAKCSRLDQVAYHFVYLNFENTQGWRSPGSLVNCTRAATSPGKNIFPHIQTTSPKQNFVVSNLCCFV